MVKLSELELIDHIKILISLTNFNLKRFLLENRYSHYTEFGKLYNDIIENVPEGTHDLESFNEKDETNELLDKYYHKSSLSKLELPYFESGADSITSPEWSNWDMFDIKSKLLMRFGSYGTNFARRSMIIRQYLQDIVYNSFMNKVKSYPGGSKQAFCKLAVENYNAVYVFLAMIKSESGLKKNVTVGDLGHIPMELLSLQFGMK